MFTIMKFLIFWTLLLIAYSTLKLYLEDLVAFNYGPEENLQRYGSTKPPRYDLSKVTVPVDKFVPRKVRTIRKEVGFQNYTRTLFKYKFYLVRILNG